MSIIFFKRGRERIGGLFYLRVCLGLEDGHGSVHSVKRAIEGAGDGELVRSEA